MGRNKEGDCDTMTQTEKDDKDSIDRLPDGILIQILSSLPVNEAARTGVLSRRWKHLWTHITSLNCICLGSGYENSMRKICSSIQSPSIENLRMSARRDDYDQAIADNWVRFALEKKVKNFELITNTSRFRHMLSCSAAEHLKSLTLIDISISGMHLERGLANCKALEHVSIENLTTLRSLRVGNRHRSPYQQHNLKILKVFHCLDLRDVWISAPKLSEFQYEGQAISFHIENVPSLCRVYLVGSQFDDCLSWAFRALPGYLCQLQTLVLRCSTLSDMNFLQSDQWKLFSLRKLTLRMSGYNDSSILNLLFLLDAAPNLGKFRFESDITPSEFLLMEKTVSPPRPHQNLKMLEFVGCIGCANVVNFIRCVIRAAPKLEKVTFDPFPGMGNFRPQWPGRTNYYSPTGLRSGLMSC